MTDFAMEKKLSGICPVPGRSASDAVECWQAEIDTGGPAGSLVELCAGVHHRGSGDVS
jgi:hypothetical protein